MSEQPAAEHTPPTTTSTAVATVDSAGDADETSTPGCPICEFIEAGPCGSQHKVWVACRGEAKQQDVDFVQHCGDTFRAFFGCMLSNQDYYKPFLEAFHVDTDLSQQAIDKAKARRGEGQAQQEQQTGQHQQQQQQHRQQQQPMQEVQAAQQAPSRQQEQPQRLHQQQHGSKVPATGPQQQQQQQDSQQTGSRSSGGPLHQPAIS